MTDKEFRDKIIKILDLILDQLWHNGQKSEYIKKAKRGLRYLK